MKASGETVNGLEERQKILQKELDASREKVSLLSNKLEAAKNVYGENSAEAQNWSIKLTDAKNVQENIAIELSKTTEKLEEQRNAEKEMSAEALEAAEKLKQQAEAEEKLKASLDQADSKIRQFDQELQLNATKLEGAKNKTELLKERQKLLTNQSKEAASKTKILEEALETCAKEVGKNSDEYVELKSKLTDAKIKQEEIRNEIKNTTEELKEQKSVLETAGEGIGKFGEGAESIGQSLKGTSTAAAGVLTGASAAAISFESAFAGVKKTVDEVYDANGNCTYSYQQLEDGIRSMAKEIPASTTEIASVAESAGQLGIKTEDILGFTRVMIDMGNSTNLASDEAATSIAKFANITGLAADESMSAEEKYKKMGSTIVELGNNYATTEADIMDMATNLASAGTQVGMSESDILALATALSSVGLESQAGGTAFSKAMINMQLAVETNSDSLKDWADVAGMSVDEFSSLFKEDATGALEAFIKGLSECGGETDSAIKVLDDMGITETRMRDALLRSANASDVFTSAIKTGKDAWEENTALTEEANKRYETTASQLAIMKNNIYDAGITIGSVFLPQISDVTKKITSLADKISKMDEKQQKAILAIGVFIALLSPLLIFIGKVSTGISAVISVGSKIPGMFAGASAAATEGGAAMAAGATAPLEPILLIVAAIAAVIGIIVALWKRSEEFRDFVTNAVGTIKETISGFLENIGISEKIESIKNTVGKLGERIEGLTNLFKVIGVVAGIVVVSALGILFTAFNIIISVIEPIIEIIGGIIDMFAGLGDIIVGVVTGDLELAKQGLEKFFSGVEEVMTGIVDFIGGAIEGLLEGIFGFAQSLLDAFGLHEVANSVYETFENIRTAIESKIEGTKNYIRDGFSLIRSFITDPIGQSQAIVSEIFENIRRTTESKINQVKDVARIGFSLAETYITDPIKQAYTIVSGKFEEIRSTIETKIDNASNTVKKGIEKIKGFFDFNWSLPKLKLPHFKISGSFSLKPPSVPKFDVEWYATGKIFKKATIIPAYSGFKGVGEAGEEAVAPITLLRSYVAEEMERVMSRIQIEDKDPINYERLADEMAKRKVVIEYKGREFARVIEEVMA